MTADTPATIGPAPYQGPIRVLRSGCQRGAHGLGNRILRTAREPRLRAVPRHREYRSHQDQGEEPADQRHFASASTRPCSRNSTAWQHQRCMALPFCSLK